MTKSQTIVSSLFSILGMLHLARSCRGFAVLSSKPNRGLTQSVFHTRSILGIHKRSILKSAVSEDLSEPQLEPQTVIPPVDIVYQNEHCVVASKPPAVVCHHSSWAGSRGGKTHEPEISLLQRVRQTTGGRRVNLVHRLDRGASGCVICAFAESETKQEEGVRGPTAQLSDALQSDEATKTYVALVRGAGILKDEDLSSKGWFLVDRPIKDERGNRNNATTWFRFVAGYHNETTGARASLVLARPTTGRWHQIRRHLNGLSHPILGDTSHGSSQTNRQWRAQFDLPYERLCLHLARIQLPSTDFTPELDVSSPLPPDICGILERHLPQVLHNARDTLEQEGIRLDQRDDLSPNESTSTLQTDPARDDNVTILLRGKDYVVVAKPPGVVCHNSQWTKSESRTPMLQRVRDSIGRVNVNLIHRLDQSASGCLLLSLGSQRNSDRQKLVTRALIEALQSPDATKTYVAVTVGDRVTTEELERGWFLVDHPVKDEHGKSREAQTWLKFVAGNDEASLVLARPLTGRWHQIRQHLRQRYHPILGDTTHGYSRTNREWKEKPNGAVDRRTYLHLARIQVPATEYTDAIHVSCPLAEDMTDLLQNHCIDLLPTLEAALATE